MKSLQLALENNFFLIRKVTHVDIDELRLTKIKVD